MSGLPFFWACKLARAFNTSSWNPIILVGGSHTEGEQRRARPAHAPPMRTSGHSGGGGGGQNRLWPNPGHSHSIAPWDSN